MERNMDLIKEILQKLEVQKTFGGGLGAKSFPDHPPEYVSHHIAIMKDAGLIEAKETKKGMNRKFVAQRLTWQGHDFLDAAKVDTIWNKAKEVLKEKGGLFSIEILKKTLTKLAMGYVFPEIENT